MLQTLVDSCTELELHSLTYIHPVQLLVQKTRQATVVLVCVADNTSSGLQYSPRIVSDRHGRPRENGKSYENIYGIYTRILFYCFVF